MEATEATIQQRENLEALNKDKANDQKHKSSTPSKARAKSSVNPIEMILMLTAAIILDGVDFLDLTVFLAILTKFITIPVAFGFWLLRMMKHQSGPKKDPTFQIIIAAIPQMIPFISIVPAWTFFVLYCWFQDSKLGKKTIGKAQKLKQAKT